MDLPVSFMSIQGCRKLVMNPTFFDSGEDSAEVVVHKDHIGSFLGYIGTALAHGHTNISHLERGCIVNCDGRIKWSNGMQNG